MKKLIFNPFVRYAGGTALAIGVAGILFTALISCFSKTRFDGVIDIHIALSIDPAVCFLEGFVNWLSLVVVFYLMGLILTGLKVRFIDIAGTMALARLPLVLASLLGFVVAFNKTTDYILWKFLEIGKEVTINFGDIFFFIICVIMLLLIVIWTIALMYNAYSVSANLKGSKATISFIIGLILAEAISKVFYYYTGYFNPVFSL
jgi:hypothetical protein